MDPDTPSPDPQPSAFNYILSFILVGIAWGFTTPFIRRAAVDFNKKQESQSQRQQQQRRRRAEQHAHEGDGEADEDRDTEGVREGERVDNGGKMAWLRTKLLGIFHTVINLLRTPAYAIPLVLNLTGSVWFFLLVGKHELSLTVPITNSMAFLFTVLGEWYLERKVIAKETWLGLILVLGGIALCVQSKNST